MEARMKHVITIFPGVLKALQELNSAAEKGGISRRTLELVHLRASQINGCSVCVAMHARDLRKMGETDDRLFAVAAWRDAPFFTDAERAALALTEAATRISDKEDPVTDEVWAEAAKHYGEEALAQLLVHIAGINVWNRFNVATKQPAWSEPRD
jgi:AhpD family alkylhydroperoxidase